MYHESKKIYFFIGKIVRRYLKDEDGPAVQLELDCLKRPVSSTATILEENPAHLRDCGIFLIHNIICGPLKMEYPWREINGDSMNTQKHLKRMSSCKISLAKKSKNDHFRFENLDFQLVIILRYLLGNSKYFLLT